jgi:glutamine synthetase
LQTGGSSVVLPGIAILNDGKVDLVADPGVRWYADYNRDRLDPLLHRRVGTLRIPSILKHRERFVDSRAILTRAVESVTRRLAALLAERP